MTGEKIAAGKPLSAFVAAEWFSARVCPEMDDKGAVTGKVLAALVAAEKILARVRLPMAVEIASVREVLAAVVTMNGFLARVHRTMGLATLFKVAGVATECALPRAHLLMAKQSVVENKSITTFVAKVVGFRMRKHGQQRSRLLLGSFFRPHRRVEIDIDFRTALAGRHDLEYLKLRNCQVFRGGRGDETFCRVNGSWLTVKNKAD